MSERWLLLCRERVMAWVRNRWAGETMVEKMLSHSIGRKMVVMSKGWGSQEWVRGDKGDKERNGWNDRSREKRGEWRDARREKWGKERGRIEGWREWREWGHAFAIITYIGHCSFFSPQDDLGFKYTCFLLIMTTHWNVPPVCVIVYVFVCVCVCVQVSMCLCGCMCCDGSTSQQNGLLFNRLSVPSKITYMTIFWSGSPTDFWLHLGTETTWLRSKEQSWCDAIYLSMSVNPTKRPKPTMHPSVLSGFSILTASLCLKPTGFYWGCKSFEVGLFMGFVDHKKIEHHQPHPLRTDCH